MSECESPQTEFDPGSFRDRSARILRSGNDVFRLINATGLSDWHHLVKCGLASQLMTDGTLVPTKEIADPEKRLAGTDAVASGFCSVLQHECIPLISYPWEWTFRMLKDAAVLQLQLMIEALQVGMILKDASPFNIQFRGARPIFIDTSSFAALRPGQAWEGYRQFCQMFLFPLMLQAWHGIDFQMFLRGSLEGISPQLMWKMLTLRDLFRRGALTHVFLHSRLSTGNQTQQRVPESLQASGFSGDLIIHNVRNLLKLVNGMKWMAAWSQWSEYDQTAAPVKNDSADKEQFVTCVMEQRRRSCVWDIGCNRGRYSRLAAQHADLVVAMDSDHLTVDLLYRSLHRERIDNIVPLVFNIADPSPAQGWRCRERSALWDRSHPDLILVLAVIHHLVFRENLLLQDVISWLADFRAELVLEYVDKSDPQVQQLLANRPDQYTDYSRENFEHLIQRYFSIRARKELSGGTRCLFHLQPI
ncbi:MAG: class I SAM-dependent methyltransferase [Planctomycetaceae bacterium]|nr:class I SAM-dependent methyltransferase [Planctomycetaceae bacterium]